MERMAKSVYRMTGQVCMAIKRIYVPESIKGKFLDAFTRTVDNIVVGDGLDTTVTMGPMHTARSLDRAQAIVADAARRDAKVQVLGQVPDKAGFGHGHFMQPTVVSDIAEDAPLMVEEILSRYLSRRIAMWTMPSPAQMQPSMVLADRSGAGISGVLPILRESCARARCSSTRTAPKVSTANCLMAGSSKAVSDGGRVLRVSGNICKFRL